MALEDMSLRGAAGQHEIIKRSCVVRLAVPRTICKGGRLDGAKKFVVQHELHQVHLEIDVTRLTQIMAASALKTIGRKSVAVHGVVKARLDREPFHYPINKGGLDES